MKTIKIGNSQGIIIPKRFIKKYGLTGEIEIVEQRQGILIKKVGNTREGWGDAFKMAVKSGEYEQLVPDVLDDDYTEGY
jgi:antitoxin MazE